MAAQINQLLATPLIRNLQNWLVLIVDSQKNSNEERAWTPFQPN